VNAVPFDLPDPQQVASLVGALAAGSPEFAAALKTGARPAEALGRVGMGLCGEKQAAVAIEVFRAAVALEPSNPLGWLNLAVALDRSGAPAGAVPCLERSLALSDRQASAWLLLGSVKAKLQDLGGAEAAYRAALLLERTSPLVWQCLGLVMQQRADLPAAIDCFFSCVACGGGTAAVLGNLAKLCYQAGRFRESAEVYAAALEQDPDNPNYPRVLRQVRFLQGVRDGRPVDEALTDYERSLPADAPDEDRDLNALLRNAFAMLRTFGPREAAVRVGRKWLERTPGNASAEYLLEAAAGETGLERSPSAYIVEYFDDMAKDFDQKLVGSLRYALPAQLCATVEQLVEPGRQFEVLDAGCGTGLCGPLLRPMARQLVGVDLSPKMLEQARRRGSYDDLACEDLVAFLRRSAGQFDVVVAADVLIYFGDLRPVWEAARAALRPGGLLAFSLEAADGDGYRLQQSGRFAHSLDYVRSSGAGLFEERACFETTIRLEAMRAVRGHCFILARR
jgi:predicted TPR repeat methyltransferase